jgi:predicted DNA-binding transcriptional regulator AlpA
MFQLLSYQTISGESIMNHKKPGTSFDELPDLAYIQIKPLVSYKVLPYSATTIWRKCRQGEFPRPIKISPGITAFRVGDIRKYLKGLSNQRDP